MPLVWSDSRVLAAQELTRLAAAIAGTYVVPTASGGAVSTSAAMTVAVAAITTTTGLYVNAVQDTTGYAGGTTVIATADPTNPRRDYVWYDGAGAIGNTTGTPAANPVLPDLTAGRIALAEIYVTAGLATIASGNIIDRRAVPTTIPTAAVVLAGSSSAATSTTSTSAVDLVTISGLSILVTTPFRVEWNGRKQALAANFAAFGIKANATVVAEADGVAGQAWSTSATNQSENGLCVFACGPRSSANYLSGWMGLGTWHASGSGGATGGTTAHMNVDGTLAPMPNATITSIAIRAKNDTVSNAIETTSIRILTGIN